MRIGTIFVTKLYLRFAIGIVELWVVNVSLHAGYPIDRIQRSVQFRIHISAWYSLIEVKRNFAH